MAADGAIGIEQVGLGSVLKQNSLVVPPNQREYAWEDKYVKNLYQDLAKAISDDDGPYFLGTLVTIPRANGVLEVVDGQQRLTTTTILLAAIRDYLRTTEPDIAASIDTDFLSGFDRARREHIPKLTLNLDDNDFFKAKLTNGQAVASTRHSHKLLQGAFDLARAHVRSIVGGLDPKDHGDLLNKWIGFIQHSAIVILLRVPNQTNAFRMFETLNDRGLKTSQADLIKNYIFGRAAERMNEVQQKWTLMRGALESLDNDDITLDFLRHALINIRGFLREPQLYEKVQDLAKSPQQVVTLATNLETMATTYVAIHNPEHEKWNRYPAATRRAIEVLNLFNIRPMRALMLGVASRLDPKETSAVFVFLISLGVRLLIAGTTRSGSVETPLADVAHKVFGGEVTTGQQVRAALKNITPTDKEFREAFQTHNATKAALARYYLRSLEMAAKELPEPWHIPIDDPEVINLEHILPRKPRQLWPSFENEEVMADYVNRLGNQALLLAKDNARLRSDVFADKRAVYADAGYVFTSQVAEATDWGPAEVDARQQQMAEYALKAWPV